MTDRTARWDRAGRDEPEWRHRRRRFGVVAVVLLSLFEVVGTFGANSHRGSQRSVDALAIACVLIGPAGLAVIRRRTTEVVALEVLALLVYLARGYVYGPVVLAPALALFVAVVLGRRVVAGVGLAVLYTGHLLIRSVVLDESLSWGEVLGVAAWGLVILVAGEAVRTRRERMAEAGAVRREARRREANEERLRIARELHDVVAHHMSLINVQASVALHLVDRRPEQVETALTVIKDASKEALVELRSLVGVLRDEAEEAPRAPTAMLDSLDDVAARSAVAGLVLSNEVVGDISTLPVAVELAAFRIVQEAVTNVVRHSGATAAAITLDCEPGRLRVRIDDDGRGLPEAAEAEGWTDDVPGSGLRGMRERASALGGSLTLGRSPLGGLSIEALLPWESDA